jgi:hypothetical protein
MAGGLLAPKIVFICANVVLLGAFSWPPCHIVNSTSYAIWERVKEKDSSPREVLCVDTLFLQKSHYEGDLRENTIPQSNRLTTSAWMHYSFRQKTNAIAREVSLS